MCTPAVLCTLWLDVCGDAFPFPPFYSGLLVFMALYIFWMRVSFQAYDLQVFFLGLWLIVFMTSAMVLEFRF